MWRFFVFVPLFAVSGCMLPTVQKEWHDSTLPSLKRVAASTAETVVSLLPGLGGAFIEDASELIPNLLKEVGIRKSEEDESEE